MPTSDFGNVFLLDRNDGRGRISMQLQGEEKRHSMKCIEILHIELEVASFNWDKHAHEEESFHMQIHFSMFSTARASTTTYSLGQNKIRSYPPLLPKSVMNSRARQNAPFFHH